MHAEVTPFLLTFVRQKHEDILGLFNFSLLIYLALIDVLTIVEYIDVLDRHWHI